MDNQALNKVEITQRESLIALLRQLASNSVALVRDELELVTHGVHDKVRAVSSGLFTVAAGAAIGFAAFLSLCAALIIELTSYMTPVNAALVTAAALALLGIVIVVAGFSKLKRKIS
jgi:hypothetical protein